MNALLEKLFHEVRASWRFRRWALIAAAIAAVGGWLVVFSLPDRFQADALIFVDTRTALRPVLQGISVQQDVNAQLNFVRQSLLAGPQLKQIGLQSGVLPPTVVDPREEAGILEGLANRVVLSVRSASPTANDNERDAAGAIYGITYQDPSRERALRVVDTLLNTLVEKTLGGKREGSESAQKFLEIRIKEYEKRLRDAEDRLADFKKHNIGLMPAEGGGYFAQLQAEVDAAKRAETALSIATSKRAELQRQLRGETAIAAAGSTSMIGAGGMTGGTDTLSRIKQTQARLDELLLVYTDKHPDVIAARQTLEELQRRRTAEIDSLKRGDAAAVAASGAGSNPVYQSIQVALNQAEVEIATLRGEVSQRRAKAAELRQRLDTAPKVEAEFAQLNRDYDVNKSQYTALLANYEKAKLGEQADSAGSVRFEIVKPPIAGFVPVFPQRGLFLSLVLLGALIIGAALAYLLNLLRPVVGSARSLIDLTGLPVLGVVSVAFPGRLNIEARREVLSFAGGVAALCVGLLVALVLSRAGLRLANLVTGVG